MGEHSLRAFGMMLDRPNAAAARRAHDHRAAQPPARAVAQARGVVGELIDRRVDEAGKLDLRYRAETLGREADGHSGYDALGERGVEHTVGAKALEQPFGCAEYASFGADILAEDEDRGIVGHGAGK